MDSVSYTEDIVLSGPILESKGMCAISQKRAKKGKIFQNLGTNVQNLKYFQKGQVIACDNHTQKTARIDRPCLCSLYFILLELGFY